MSGVSETIPDVKQPQDSGAKLQTDCEPVQFDGSRPYVVRISGYDYTKFKQGLHQPYDPVFQHAMVLTMNDLIVAFQACTGYTHHFDIILVFDKNRSTISQSPVRVLTVYTSYATVKFNHYMAQEIQNEFYVASYLPSKYQSVMSKQTIFYATFFQAPDANTKEFDQKIVLLKHLIDRCRHAALFRSLQQWTSSLLGPDVVAKYTSGAELPGSREASREACAEQMVQALGAERGIRWQLDVPLFMSYGIFGKVDVMPQLRGKDPRDEPRMRRVSNRAIVLDESDHSIQWMFAPHWPILKRHIETCIVTPQMIFDVQSFIEK